MCSQLSLLLIVFPTPLLSFKTLFEHLYSRPPSFHHLCVFGCLAYATTVFIGYLVGHKAYKLYDLSSHKIFYESRCCFPWDILPLQFYWPRAQLRPILSSSPNYKPYSSIHNTNTDKSKSILLSFSIVLRPSFRRRVVAVVVFQSRRRITVVVIS